jgi:hypothetical protein
VEQGAPRQCSLLASSPHPAGKQLHSHSPSQSSWV